MTTLALDTHALLWMFGDRRRLSKRAASAIDDAERILVSPLCFWEVGMLGAKGRIVLDRPASQWANDVLAEPNVELLDLDAAAAIRASELEGFHGDPVDRLIVASALAERACLVTKDQQIHDWATASSELDCVW